MPAPTNRNQRDKKGINVTAKRGFFLSSLATQCGQTSHLHASALRKNGVAMSCAQTGHFVFAMAHTPFSVSSTLPWVVPPRQWNFAFALIILSLCDQSCWCQRRLAIAGACRQNEGLQPWRLRQIRRRARGNFASAAG